MPETEESNLVAYARNELEIAGLFGEGSDYDGMLGHAVLNVVQAFSGSGHSGASAGMAVAILEKVLRYEPLTPLTGEESEWTILDYDDRMYAQSKRCPSVFQRRDGTAWNGDGKVFRDPEGFTYTSKDSVVDITFPYTPTTEIVDVPADA